MVLPETDHPLMTTTEVAAIFRVDPKTVARWAGEGRIKGVRTLGGFYRFPRAEVQRVLSEGMAASGAPAPASRRLSLRPEAPPAEPSDIAPPEVAPSDAVLSDDKASDSDDEFPDITPEPDADVVWAYFDADTGDAVLTLTDDACGVLRLRTDREEHEAVLLAVLTAACAGARTAVDESTRNWWAAVARRGEAVLDQVRGVGRLPQVSREDP
ncbi:helix-turn-helix domain-containing protein [Nocardiopsis suaedae]|uniref:helix-turn-helix domain-containing protein n=1 Tax=Nocardiopsis suaedae TaxID=3018444 RepID=UPI0038CDB133